MGIAERKEREKEERRNMIIDAAERVIFSNRIDTSTMDQIAEEAELSKGTLYLYFKSKTDLYLAIQDRGMSILADKLARVLGEKRKGIDLLKRFGEVYFDYANQFPNYFNAEMFCRSHEFMEETTASELFQSTRDKRIEIVSYIIRGIQIGLQDGSIRKDVQPEELSLMLYASMNGMIQAYMLRKQVEKHDLFPEVRVSIDHIVQDFIRIQMDGLKPENVTNGQNLYETQAILRA
jgi:AcrR family transcriptional regulator